VETEWLTATEAAQYLKVQPAPSFFGPAKAGFPHTGCPVFNAAFIAS
jgi:hypothetical protein